MKKNGLSAILQLFIITSVFLGLTVSCSEEGENGNERKELFVLEYGKLADELDVFEIEGLPGLRKNGIFMKDGFFYVVNGNSDKMLHFSSYGDLLSAIMEKESNPEPLTLQPYTGDGAKTRIVSYFPLTNPRHIVIDSKKNIFVAADLPSEQAVYDIASNSRLESAVMRFNELGEYQGHIGQEGNGGQPFGLIEDVIVTLHDEIVVITRSPEGWIVYWYSNGGRLLYQMPITLDNLPEMNAEGRKEGQYSVLERVYPDITNRRVYIQVNFYQQEFDEQTKTIRGIEDIYPRLYWLDLDGAEDTPAYQGNIELPKNISIVESSGGFENIEVENIYQFLGVLKDERLAFIARTDTDLYDVMIMNLNADILLEQEIFLEEENLHNSDLYITPDGILNALITRYEDAVVAWWRLDIKL